MIGAVTFEIVAAAGDDSEWTARLMAASDPWITLGRGRGAGAALLEHCERQAGLTSRHFFLCVSSFNTRARTFYAGHGYRQVGQFDDYVIDGASELLLYKRVR